MSPSTKLLTLAVPALCASSLLAGCSDQKLGTFNGSPEAAVLSPADGAEVEGGTDPLDPSDDVAVASDDPKDPGDTTPGSEEAPAGEDVEPEPGVWYYRGGACDQTSGGGVLPVLPWLLIGLLRRRGA